MSVAVPVGVAVGVAVAVAVVVATMALALAMVSVVVLVLVLAVVAVMVVVPVPSVTLLVCRPVCRSCHTLCRARTFHPSTACSAGTHVSSRGGCGCTSKNGRQCHKHHQEKGRRSRHGRYEARGATVVAALGARPDHQGTRTKGSSRRYRAAWPPHDEGAEMGEASSEWRGQGPTASRGVERRSGDGGSHWQQRPCEHKYHTRLMRAGLCCPLGNLFIMSGLRGMQFRSFAGVVK